MKSGLNMWGHFSQKSKSQVSDLVTGTRPIYLFNKDKRAIEGRYNIMYVRERNQPTIYLVSGIISSLKKIMGFRRAEDGISNISYAIPSYILAKNCKFK